MKKTLLLPVFVILFGLFMMPVHGEVVTNEKIPIDSYIWNEAAGELVHITGCGHSLTTTTADKNGGFHVHMHVNAQGYSGIGLTSGDKYQVTGATDMVMNFRPPFPSEQSGVAIMNVVGPGRGNNMQMYMHMHITVNANGDVTAEVYTIRTISK